MASFNNLLCGGTGAFSTISFSDAGFVDGLSNTAMFSERTKGTGKNMAAVPPGPSDIITMPNRTNTLVDPNVI
jgi:hypothetical protein